MKEEPILRDEGGPFGASKFEMPEAMDELETADLLLPYQKRTIATIQVNKVTFVEKSRRIGLTWGVAPEAVLVGSSERAAGGMNVFYMGYTLEMAREFILYCALWCKAYKIAASAIQEFDASVEYGVEEKDIRAFRITLPSGFRIEALPCRPEVLRGKQGLVIFDEVAFMKNVKATIKAAMALIIHGGRLVFISSHNGTDNAFNQEIDRIRAGKRKGAVVTITFQDAIADGLYERIKLCTPPGEEIADKEQWIQDVYDFYGEDAEEELDVVPAAGSGTWIHAQDIAACEHPEAGRPELYQGGLVYIGYDVARRNDGIIIWAFELVGDVLWLRDRWEERGKKFSEQSAALADIVAKRRGRVAAIRIDQTGMGEKVVEDEAAKYGETLCQGRLLTGPERLRLATILRDRFESCKIRIPPDPVIRVDLRALKRAGPEGKALVEGKEVHPDRFWAAGLACEAAEEGTVLYDYTPARQDNARDDDDDFRRRWGERGDSGGHTAHGLGRGGSW